MGAIVSPICALSERELTSAASNLPFLGATAAVGLDCEYFSASTVVAVLTDGAAVVPSELPFFSIVSLVPMFGAGWNDRGMCGCVLYINESSDGQWSTAHFEWEWRANELRLRLSDFHARWMPINR